MFLESSGPLFMLTLGLQYPSLLSIPHPHPGVTSFCKNSLASSSFTVNT